MIDKITILLLISGVCLNCGAMLSPGPVYGAVGGSVLFETNITSSGKPLRIVWWDHEGNMVASSVDSDIDQDPAYNDRVKLDTLTGSLGLKDLTVSDSGQYTVSITKTSGTPEIKRQTTLHVFETVSGVSLTGPAQPLTEDQSSANLTCEGTGSIITTEWMKDGQPLSPSNSTIFSADLRSVSISPVRRSDIGEYQCRLSNPVSSDTATYTMTVNYKDPGKDSIVKQTKDDDNKDVGPSADTGLGGGAVAGIVIGCLLAASLGVGVFVLYKRGRFSQICQNDII